MGAVEQFYAFVDRPLFLWARPVLVLLLVPLGLAMAFPLWHVALDAPQYPNGLDMDIYAYTVVGGHGGADIADVNVLNHYIGMHAIERAELTELDWLPFGIGVVALLVLRVAALGNVRSLVDIAVLVLYLGAFAMGRFIYQLHVYGHELAPDAALKVAPFTPSAFGTTRVGDFVTHAFPGPGAWLLAVFGSGIVVLAGWHLLEARRHAITND